MKKRSVRGGIFGRFFVIVTAVAFASSCKQNEEVQHLVGSAQGTYYNIHYVDPLDRDLEPQVDSLLDAFDQDASLWVEGSLLRRLNAGLTDTLSPILEQLLKKSLWCSDYTNGAFDCRIGKLVQAWGFSYANREEPDSATLSELVEAAKGEVGAMFGRYFRDNPNTELDFNAIAQGYSVDLLGELFRSMGVENYLIDVGGEVLANGCKPGGKAWRVGIEKPAADSLSSRVVQTAIELRDCSVVTSGNYRKYYEHDGVKYSHTIDPSTGRPVQHSLLSVSVVAEESWMADAMATAYMVMGKEKAEEFIRMHKGQPGTDAVLFIYDSAGQMLTKATDAFMKMEIKR